MKIRESIPRRRVLIQRTFVTLSNSLDSLSGGFLGGYIGDYHIGVIKGDIRSLDYGSYCGFS